MMARKRESSKWVFSKELKDTTFVEELPENERGKPFVVTPLGTRIKRILIAGLITAKNSEENLTKLTVADNLGSFYVSVFKNEYQPGLKEEADSLEINAKVVIMGRVNSFKTEEGVLYLNINPEKIMHGDSLSLAYWAARATFVVRRKILAIQEMKKLDSPDKQKIVAMGYSEEEAECALRHIEHYKTYNVTEMLAAVMSSSKMPSDSQEESGNKEKVLIFIKTHSDPQKGCRYEDIIAYMKDNGMEQADTDELLNQLGADGDIYEVSLKRYKAV